MEDRAHHEEVPAPGALAEEIDPAHQEPLGNVPQAFSHVGLIQAIVLIEEARRARREGRAPRFNARFDTEARGSAEQPDLSAR